MNDTQLVEHLMAELGIKTREDLTYWIENFSEGYECDHYYGMVYDEGYRIETDREKEVKRAKARAHNREMQRRWNAGERDIGMLVWKTMQSYTQKLSNNIFSARPLLWQLTENKDDA